MRWLLSATPCCNHGQELLTYFHKNKHLLIEINSFLKHIESFDGICSRTDQTISVVHLNLIWLIKAQTKVWNTFRFMTPEVFFPRTLVHCPCVFLNAQRKMQVQNVGDFCFDIFSIRIFQKSDQWVISLGCTECFCHGTGSPFMGNGKHSAPTVHLKYCVPHLLDQRVKIQQSVLGGIVFQFVFLICTHTHTNSCLFTLVPLSETNEFLLDNRCITHLCAYLIWNHKRASFQSDRLIVIWNQVSRGPNLYQFKGTWSLQIVISKERHTCTLSREDSAPYLTIVIWLWNNRFVVTLQQVVAVESRKAKWPTKSSSRRHSRRTMNTGRSTDKQRWNTTRYLHFQQF